tara:strand:+ start:1961 stop:2398 length:438 start_codon:yes stop_codon:yes gene_type:complete
MNQTKKIVAFGIGIIAIGGVAWYLMTKRKETEARMSIDPSMLPPMPAPSSTTTTATAPAVSEYQSEVRIGNARGLGKYNWYGVDSKDRGKFDAGTEIGTVGLVNGEETCTISDFWIDANGKKAAFKCEEKNKGTYDIPGGSRFEY